jgi:hypothetical protein
MGENSYCTFYIKVRKLKAPNQFLQADPGDSAIKIGLRSPGVGSDPEGDLSPPRSAEKWRWAARVEEE